MLPQSKYREIGLFRLSQELIYHLMIGVRTAQEMQRRGRGVEAQKNPVFIGVIDRMVQRLIVHLPLQMHDRFSRLHSSSFHLSAVGWFLGCNVLEGGGENRTSSQRNHFTPIIVSQEHANREMERLFLGALLLYYYYRYFFFYVLLNLNQSMSV